MESINPNDINELDTGTISYITLKNGNMVMVDDSVPEKLKKEKNIKSIENSKNLAVNQPLTVSEKIIVSFKEEEKNFDIKMDIETGNKKSEKNNFNLISKVSKNTNFSFQGKKENIKNNISNISSDKNEFLKDKENISQNDENITSSNKINNTNNEENKEGNNVRDRIRRKSMRFIEQIEKMVGEKNKHTVKAVISLYIPSDVQSNLNATQKHFNKLVSQLRQKQNKFRKGKGGIIGNKLYDLYKENSNKIYKDVLSPFMNRIKYYQESEKEDLSKNKLSSFSNGNYLKTSLNINNRYNLMKSTNSLYSSFDNKNININKSLNLNENKYFNLNKSINSFYGNKNRSSSGGKYYSMKLIGKNLGYSSALVYPTNRFISKLNLYH